MIYTGSYSINDTELLLQPSSGRWVARNLLGVDGAGHPVYSGVREFELSWEALYPSHANQLQTFFNTVVTTGTAVVGLPKYAQATYQLFYNYSGCTLREPEWGEFFAENYLSAKMLITNIRT